MKTPTKPNKRGGDRNLPEKEFRIMIIKMIQNLENKTELQINNLDTRIEKILDHFYYNYSKFFFR